MIEMRTRDPAARRTPHAARRTPHAARRTPRVPDTIGVSHIPVGRTPPSDSLPREAGEG